MSAIVAMPAAPLYDMGWNLPRVSPRRVQAVRQPAFPLYEGGAFYDGVSGLGADPAKIVGASAPIAATATSTILASMWAGTSMASWAGPIGVGVGVLLGVIAGLWAAHEARVKGAKAENQAINSAVQTFDAGLHAIFDAANSSDPAKNVPGSIAAQQVQQLYSDFWAHMAPYMHSPGTADASGGGVNCGQGLNPAGPCVGTPGGHKCDKSCTATCCVGCQDLYPTMLQAIQVLNSPTGGTVQVCAIARSSYGANARGGYSLTYTPPTASSMVSSLFGGDGGLSLLPLLAIGAVAFFALRG